MAYLLDGLVVGAISTIPLSLAGFDPQRLGSGSFPDRNVFVASELVALVVYAAYFTWFWSGGRRATPGQRVFSIQVGNAFDGRPLSTSQAFKRWLATGQWLGLFTLQPFLFLALVSMVGSVAWNLVLVASTITSPTKQGLHNRWALGCLWALIALVGLEVLLLIALFNGAPSSYNQSDVMREYLRDYFRWLWPS
jgi:RDD family protein